jgi:hypothetical protein
LGSDNGPLPNDADEELRTRTGVLPAASSLAASFLGQQAFQDPSPRELAITALVAFVLSIGPRVYILMPKENLFFSEAGAGAQLAARHFSLYDSPSSPDSSAG